MSGTPKSLAVLLSALMAGGCANCDPYSAHPSLGCLVSLNALALAALGPHAMMSEVLAERRDDAQRENTWKRLQANDPQTVADCVIKCNLPIEIEKDHKKRDEIDAHNANQVISWWAAHPLPEQIPALMQAYLYKGAESMQSAPATANVFLRKAAKLAMNPGIPTGTPTSPSNAWTYTYTAEKIQRNLLVLRYRALLKPQPDTGDFQCQAIAAWPPPWLQENADDGLRRSCRLAFNDLFHQWPGPNDRLAVVPGIFAPLPAKEN